MSSEQFHQGNLDTKMDCTKDEELDANDLEVAMINESFEQQFKHSQLFYNPNLKSAFYGDNSQAEITGTKEGESHAFTDEEVKIKLTPLQFLPCITPQSELEDDFGRGLQLDMELERMMLEEDDKYFYLDSPPLLTSPEEKQPTGAVSNYKLSSASSFLPDQSNSSVYSSFESQLEDEECADAAEAIAIDVIQSLFADEQNNPPDSITDDDDDENMVVSASILQVLQDDDDNDIEDVDQEDMEETHKLKDDPKLGLDSADEQMPPPTPRNNSLQTVSSPISDEQTVPVIDSWEDLVKEPEATGKMHNEARALLKKFRAERKATQL